MRVKIKIKNKLEDNNFFYWKVKLRIKITLIKGKTNQKNVGKNEKINIP